MYLGFPITGMRRPLLRLLLLRLTVRNGGEHATHDGIPTCVSPPSPEARLLGGFDWKPESCSRSTSKAVDHSYRWLTGQRVCHTYAHRVRSLHLCVVRFSLDSSILRRAPFSAGAAMRVPILQSTANLRAISPAPEILRTFVVVTTLTLCSSCQNRYRHWHQRRHRLCTQSLLDATRT